VIGAFKDFLKRHWPPLRLRAILLTVLLFAAAMPLLGGVFLRVYENAIVRQTEAELVAQGAALAAAASLAWPGAGAPAERAPDAPLPPEAYHPEPSTIDLGFAEVAPPRPQPRAARRPADPAAAAAARAIGPVIDRTVQTTLASVVITDRNGTVVRGFGYGGDLTAVPEVRDALRGRARSVLRRRGGYRPQYSFEWVSRASSLRLHHARPIVVDGRVRGIVLLSRSPRALFRGIYEDRGKMALGAAVILGALIVLSGLVSRGVTRPIEALSKASREVAGGRGDVPETPPTAAVEIRQLYDDFRAMAEAVDRRSGYLKDFAAAVSHEFKTPLAGIGGAVELLQDHGETMTPEERKRFLANIEADTGRLTQLVTRLLDLARADMARPEADVAADLARPIRRVADGLGDGIAVSADLPDVPPVAVPERTLEAVLTALIENSRQAGATRVTITALAGPEGVALRLQDDGPGIAEADRERLFEPFFTTRRAEGGTGLGLSIARSLLQASGARIAALPSEKGALFEITLPVAG